MRTKNKEDCYVHNIFIIQIFTSSNFNSSLKLHFFYPLVTILPLEFCCCQTIVYIISQWQIWWVMSAFFIDVDY